MTLTAPMCFELLGRVHRELRGVYAVTIETSFQKTRLQPALFANGFILCGHGNDRSPGNLEFQVVRGNSQDKGIVLDRENRPAEASAGDHFIAGFQLRKHGLPLLLPSLLRKDQQEIKDSEH